MLSCSDGPTVTPIITGPTPSFFNGGASYPAGNYSVGYVEGALKYQVNDNWAINLTPTPAGYYVTDGNGNDVALPIIDQRFATQAEAEAAYAGSCVRYVHAGGPIGVYLNDAVTEAQPGGGYGDNVAGSPNPTWMLCSGFGTCGAGGTGVAVPTLSALGEISGGVPAILIQGH